jgi:uncharacterized protein (DUF486 family)
MPIIVRTTLLLIGSNVFMTFAWYGHLKNLHDGRWYVAALASWGIALLEYLLQVPANPHWLQSINCRATQDHPGGGFRVRTVRGALHA